MVDIPILPTGHPIDHIRWNAYVPSLDVPNHPNGGNDASQQIGEDRDLDERIHVYQTGLKFLESKHIYGEKFVPMPKTTLMRKITTMQNQFQISFNDFRKCTTQRIANKFLEVLYIKMKMNDFHDL